jgi:hypothetical protein
MAGGFRDPLAGINDFAPEFWRLVADPVLVPRDAPVDPSAPETVPMPPPQEQPKLVLPAPEESPEDQKRRKRFEELGELPVYRGDPPAAQLLPPATEGEIIIAPPQDPKDVTMIIRNITKLRERLPRMEEHQKKGLADPAFDREVEGVRRQLKDWEKALAARAETGT